MLILRNDAPKLQVSGMGHADKLAVNTSAVCVSEAVILFLLPFISCNLVTVM